ncbi:MAG: dienelactone hydrolase family protein [Myxococcales bacterium]
MRDFFGRGPHPVGVITRELSDPDRNGRRIVVEVWYPAGAVHQGADLDAARQDEYPLFGGFKVKQPAVRDAGPSSEALPCALFSHGFAGHRRQSTFFCTHLASHGYVVVAPDHAGNTMNDIMMLALSLGPQQMPKNPEALLGSYVFDRPRDLGLCLDALLRGEFERAVGPVDASLGVGATGHSFGGWTSLVMAARDPRVRAVLPMAPAGGAGPLWALALERELEMTFAPGTETLYLAAERDTLLPLPGIEQMFLRTPDPVRLLVLENADHMHFCDRVERSHEYFRSMPQVGPFGAIAKRTPPMSELTPGKYGHAFACGLGLAHLESALRRAGDARALLKNAVAELSARGVTTREVVRDHRL